MTFTNNNTKTTTDQLEPTKQSTYKKSKFQDPLALIKLSSLAVSVLQFYLVQLDISQQLTLALLLIIGLYAFFYSLLFCSLKILIIRKVRARSVCLLWSWFELFQSIPLLVGSVLSGKLWWWILYKKCFIFSSFFINHFEFQSKLISSLSLSLQPS